MFDDKYGKLTDIFGNNTIGIISAYKKSILITDVCEIHINKDNTLKIYTTKTKEFKKDDLITILIDDRIEKTFVTWRLSINRVIYKALVYEKDENFIFVKPLTYTVSYRHNVIENFIADNYQYPKDERKVIDIPISDLAPPLRTSKEYNNERLGVLITKGLYHLHPTLLAYLFLADNDGIIIISQRSSFKSRLLNRDNECWFVIDNRENVHLNKNIEFNVFHLYAQIIPREIPEKHLCYSKAKELFIRINRFQKKLFNFPNIIMYHLTPQIDKNFAL